MALNRAAVLRLLTAGPLTLGLLDAFGHPLALPGYLPRELTPGAWKIKGGKAIGPDVVWQLQGQKGKTLAIRGYAVADAAGVSVLSEDFSDGPFRVEARGARLRVQPVLEVVAPA